MNGERIQKDVLNRLCFAKDTNPSKLAAELGFNRTYFAAAFAKNDGYAPFPNATLWAVCQVLGCTMEELTEPPKVEEVAPELPPELIDVIREGFRMIHGDLQELIKLWKPEREGIKIGGDASK